MRPKYGQFKQICERAKGNVSKIADAFGVERKTVYTWCEKDPRFKDCISDQRGRALDNYLNTADMIARGVPKVDKNKKFVGWKVPPDANMLKFLIGTYGRNEGFGTVIETKSEVTGKNGAPLVPEQKSIDEIKDEIKKIYESINS